MKVETGNDIGIIEVQICCCNSFFAQTEGKVVHSGALHRSEFDEST